MERADIEIEMGIMKDSSMEDGSEEISNQENGGKGGVDSGGGGVDKGGGRENDDGDDTDSSYYILVENNFVLISLILIILIIGAVCSFVLYDIIDQQALDRANGTLAHSCSTLASGISVRLQAIALLNVDFNSQLKYNVPTLTVDEFMATTDPDKLLTLEPYIPLFGAAPRTFDSDRTQTEQWASEQYQSNISFLDYDYFQQTYMPAEERSVYLPFLYTNINPPDVTFGPALGFDFLNHSVVPDTIVRALIRNRPTLSSGLLI